MSNVAVDYNNFLKSRVRKKSVQKKSVQKSGVTKCTNPLEIYHIERAQ